MLCIEGLLTLMKIHFCNMFRMLMPYTSRLSRNQMTLFLNNSKSFCIANPPAYNARYACTTCWTFAQFRSPKQPQVQCTRHNHPLKSILIVRERIFENRVKKALFLQCNIFSDLLIIWLPRRGLPFASVSMFGFLSGRQRTICSRNRGKRQTKAWMDLCTFVGGSSTRMHIVYSEAQTNRIKALTENHEKHWKEMLQYTRHSNTVKEQPTQTESQTITVCWEISSRNDISLTNAMQFRTNH